MQKIKRALCSIIIAASVIGSASLGDLLNVNDWIVYPIIYGNRKPETGFTEHPFDAEKYIVINKKGNIETYFGIARESRFYRVRDDGSAGTLGERLFYSARDFYGRIEWLFEYLNKK